MVYMFKYESVAVQATAENKLYHLQKSHNQDS